MFEWNIEILICSNIINNINLYINYVVFLDHYFDSYKLFFFIYSLKIEKIIIPNHLFLFN